MPPGRVVMTILSGAVLALSAGSSGAPPDAGRVVPQIRWENIEGRPYWLSGVRPRFSWSLGYHVVTLGGGDAILLRLPELATLRLHSTEGAVTADDVLCEQSDGSRLFARARLEQAGGRSSLLFRPASFSPTLVRLSRPVAFDAEVTLGLFVLRRDAPSWRIFHRRWVPLDAPQVEVCEEGLTGDVPYWELTPGAPATASVEGPGDLALATVLPFPATESHPRQRYRVTVALDDEARTFALETTVGDPERRWVDDPGGMDFRTGEARPAALGSERVLFVKVPAGVHALRLDVTRRTYVRALLHGDASYLTSPPSPPPYLPVARDLEAPPEVDIREDLLLPADAESRRALVLRCRREALAYSHHPLERLLFESSYARHGTFRSLVPVTKETEERTSEALPVRRRLRPPLGSSRSDRLSYIEVPERDQLPAAVFVDPSVGRGEEPLVYLLPPRSAPSLLRLLVETNDETAGARVTVESGGLPLLEARVDARSEVPPEHYEPTRTEVSLSGLENTPSRRRARHPVEMEPLMVVGSAEVEVSALVENVRVRVRGGVRPPRIAVQELVAVPSPLTESELQGLFERTREELPGRNVVLELFDEWRFARPPVTPHGKELTALLLPLFRLLESARERFASSISLSPDPPTAPAAEPPDSPLDPTEARAMEDRGQWLEALERWSRIARSATDGARDRALLGAARVLGQLGEEYLREMLLRGLVLEADEAEHRREARRLLVRDYRELGRARALLDVVVAATLREGGANGLRELSRELARAGHHRKALVVALSLPEEEQPHEVVLPCAFRAGWWGAYERAVERLPTPEERELWTALRLARRGKYGDALGRLGKAGRAGEEWSAHIREGIAITEALRRAPRSERGPLLAEWERWEGRHPGPKSWRAADELVADHDGVVECRVPARDLTVRYYRARRERPVTVRAIGEGKIRIEVRPLLDAADPERLEGRLHIRRNGLLETIPLSASHPAEGLDLGDGSTRAPGLLVESTIPIGPGPHEIEIFSPDAETVVRVRRLEPDLRLGILPPLNPDRVREVLAATPAVPAKTHRSVVGVVGADGSTESRAVVRVEAAGTPRSSVPLPESVEPMLGARLSLRFEDAPVPRPVIEALEKVARGEGNASRAERFLALRRRGLPAITLRGHPSWNDVEPRDRAAAHLAASEPAEALQAMVGRGGDSVRRRLALLVHDAEENPLRRKERFVEAEALCTAHPGVVGLRRILRRLERGTHWERVRAVDRGAGIVRVHLDRAQPESPAVRVRELLLDTPTRTGERLLGAGEVLAIRFPPTARRRLRIACTLESPPYLQRHPVTIVYRIDAGASRRLVLLPQRPEETLEVTAPDGDHTLRLWIEDPFTNHVVRVRRSSDVGRREAEDPLFSSTREYYRATRSEPLEIEIEGPAWLRIDELRDGSTRIDYRALGGGWHRLVLTPADGRDEALFRVFQRIEGPERLASVPPRIRVRSLDTPQPVVPKVALPRNELTITDAYALGGQEDGTFTVEMAGHRRRLFEEDRDDFEDARHFLEWNATYRKFHELVATFSHTRLLYRLHEEGGPTLGIVQELTHLPSWTPMMLRIEAAGYVQWPNGPTAVPSGSAEWSASVRGIVRKPWRLATRTRHVTTLSAFSRGLSLRGFEDYDPESVDQDVFSSYKSDHRWGLTISETLLHEPWLDTRWWAQVSLTTNEDFNPVDPDHLRFAAGWRQHVASWRIGLAYRAVHFLADRDRSESRTRHGPTIEVARDIWVTAGSRIEAALRFRYDLPDNQVSGFVSLAWHFSRARYYRDFYPGEVDFEPLLETAVPREHLHRFEEQHAE